MKFLARADPNRFDIATWGNGFGHFQQRHTWNLGDKNFAAVHLLDTADHEPDSLLERDPEPGHAGIGDGYFAALALLEEYRNHAAAAAQNISVAGATEPGILRTRIRIGLHEHFLRTKLGRTVQIDGIHRFVCAQGQNAAHSAVDGRIDDVASAHDVGLYGFERIVFTGRNLFQGGSVNHNRDSGKSALQTLRVANIPDEIAQAWMAETS